jgi:hypothetical protein
MSRVEICMEIYIEVIFSVVLYGSEIWSLTVKEGLEL